jgi:hypothetical protein
MPSLITGDGPQPSTSHRVPSATSPRSYGHLGASPVTGPVPWCGSTSTRTRPPSPRDGGQHDQSAEPLGFRWGSWTEQGQELTFAGACQ